MPSDIGQRLAGLEHVFRARGVRLAYLFGSLARGGAGDDVDLAVLMGQESALELFGDLVRVLGTDRIDVVDLKQASPLLRFHVVKSGVLLFRQSVAAENDFELAAIREYRDTRYHRALQDGYLRERAHLCSGGS